jgi:ubiquinone/menaquinone biosynthesis C-methylase UbiE
VNRPEAGPIGNAYDKYGSGNPIERRLMQGFFRSLDSCLVGLHPRSVLEVGAGEGEVAAHASGRLGNASVVVMDLPAAPLTAMWRRHGLIGLFGDVRNLPFPDDSFDLVLGIEVLEHVADPRAALREVARVAARDVVLSVPREPIWRMANMARGRYWSQLGNTPGHVNHWHRRGFAALVGSELDVQALHSPFPWTMVQARVRRSSDR